MAINAHTHRAERENGDYYDKFVEKFKPKKTTDDCYTPENIYSAVREWVMREYDLPEDIRVIRPFWPGGDYQNADYSGGCVVIDNPPFSILSSICQWYNEREIKFFLFAPSLTLFSIGAGTLNYIVCGVTVTYENGANVATSFVTNMGDDKIHCAPCLNEIVSCVNLENLQKITNKSLVYEYPDHVCTGARLSYLSNHGTELRIKSKDCRFIRALDAQRRAKKKIFGSGFLLSEKAAAEKAAVEKAAAEKAGAVFWPLSEEEQAIIKAMG